MRYTLLLNVDQKLVDRLLKNKGLALLSIRSALKNQLDQLPKIKTKLNSGQLLSNQEIHQVFDLEIMQFGKEVKEVIFNDYPRTLAQAQDLLHYTKMKTWTLNQSIHFKHSSSQKKALRAQWMNLQDEEMVQNLLKKMERQRRNYQEILALFPFNQAQELIADQSLLQLYQKVIRICNF